LRIDDECEGIFFFFFFQGSPPVLQLTMPTCLEDIVESYPLVTLPYAEYGRDFGLGRAINIGTSPAQRIQSFVDEEGSPYHFIIIGRLTSFNVVEDSVCLYIT
jgi:hypothetical protein